ncbi:MAG: response regulator transcription factor [Desulfobacterales bacterium]|nr:MAG: response regulator transcription factor [Desulfobacterales bacterium]
MSIRVLLADNHKFMRDGLRALIEEQPGMEVIAVAENGYGAVRLARDLKPDVVVMDIHMPELNGIDATYQIVAELPNVRVIGLSVHSERHYVVAILRAGALGYLLKDCAYEELAQAIRSVAKNQTYLSCKVAEADMRSRWEY